MSDTILLIGHGSRDTTAIAEFDGFASDLQASIGTTPVTTAFLEYAPPTILGRVQECADNGVNHITVVPLFLLPGNHIRVDVPEILAQAHRRHPQICFSYTTHLGLDNAMLDLLGDRLAQIEGEDGRAKRKESTLLVVGRGASDPEANGDLVKIARLLYEKQGWGEVETCFLGATRPGLPTGLARCRLLGARRIVVLPYLLFTGVLAKRLERIVAAEATQQPEIEYLCAHHLGRHPILVNFVQRRIAEAWPAESNLRCAHCVYRAWQIDDQNSPHNTSKSI